MTYGEIEMRIKSELWDYYQLRRDLTEEQVTLIREQVLDHLYKCTMITTAQRDSQYWRGRGL